MPRGEWKQPGVVSGVLGDPRAVLGSSRPGPAAPTEAENGVAIVRAATAFAEAWFAGDARAMMRCLHPDYLNRLVGIQGGTERPEADPEPFVLGVVGLQGRFGAKTTTARRCLEVRVLDVRSRSASAVVELGGWVLHIHLARSGGRWSIVNAMWEMGPAAGVNPALAVRAKRQA